MSDNPWAAPSPAPRAPSDAPPGYGSPSGFGSAGTWAPSAPPGGINPWAVVCLVTGVLALVPVAIVAGTVALVGLRKRPRRGQGAAVAGLVGATFWSLAVVFAAVLVATAPGAGSGALGRVADVASPTAGACLRQAGDQGDVATAVDCPDRHDAEVYAVVALPAGPWPGYDTLDDRVDDECGGDRYTSYVGANYDDSDFDYGWYVSDEAEWTAGQREAVCVVLPGFADLSGSVRGSGGSSD